MWLWIAVLIAAPLVVVWAFLDRAEVCPESAGACTSNLTIGWQGVSVVTVLAAAAVILAIVQLAKRHHGG